MSQNLKAKTQAQFGRSSHAYATSTIHAKGQSLALLVELVQPETNWQMLDVGTGAGHTALAFAPHVAGVTATDLTGAMVKKTTELAAQRGLTNVKTKIADAEALPFANASFDLVTCRLAFHHFPHPQQATREFARVLKPGGWLGFADNFTGPDRAAATYYNAYEKLRDPSHHWVYPLADLQEMWAEVGLQIIVGRELKKELEFQNWADRMRVSAPDKEELVAMMRHLPPTLQPFLAPRWADGTMYFTLHEVVLVARLPQD
ncbi:MAG: methyltransferase domain-containing protein [Anaerolineae bacterium]|nr:methyltransferase domain-containing protein [Anaerolineae bacterium]